MTPSILSRFQSDPVSRPVKTFQGWARLSQANALATQNGAARYPDLSVDKATSFVRQRTENGQPASQSVEQYALGLLSSYELDLWGRIASQQQLAANATLLELVELRFYKSLASALEVFQQRQVVEKSRSQIPLIEQSERLLLNELALLLGKWSSPVPSIRRDTLSMPPDVPAAGLPARLLTARPDVRAASLRLQAADWQVAAARAARFPNMRLTAKAAYQASDISLVLDNWLLSLAASLSAPLFDGRRRKAEIERLRAVVAEQLAAYRRTILVAVKEVEDALISEEKLREHVSGLEAQLGTAQHALHEARSRYGQGLNDYLPVH